MSHAKHRQIREIREIRVQNKIFVLFVRFVFKKNSWSKDLVVKKSVRSVKSVCVYKKDPRAK